MNSELGDLIDGNFARKYLSRDKQKFANKRLCVYSQAQYFFFFLLIVLFTEISDYEILSSICRDT